MDRVRHPAALPEAKLLKQCDVIRTRRSGPGGQHRNRRETAVVLVHRPTGIRAEAAERRSQEENRKRALRRLRITLAIEVAAPIEGPPSALWQSRCRGGQIVINSEHADFPALLAEAMSTLCACDYDVRPAAEKLACTPSQLVKFIKREPQAFAALNRRRQERNLTALF